MSPVSEKMGRRSPACAGPAGSLTLADLDRAQRATVVGFGEAVEPAVARRLFDLGLVPGTEIAMVRRAPLGDPAIYRVGDHEIALRRAQARCVHAEPAR
jgi:ferrous iron transport protein A